MPNLASPAVLADFGAECLQLCMTYFKGHAVATGSARDGSQVVTDFDGISIFARYAGLCLLLKR